MDVISSNGYAGSLQESTINIECSDVGVWALIASWPRLDCQDVNGEQILHQDRLTGKLSCGGVPVLKHLPGRRCSCCKREALRRNTP